jgi:hypothetical protein
MSLKDLLSRFRSRRIGPSAPHLKDLPEQGFEGLPDFVEPLLGWRAWKVWAPLAGSDSCPAFSSVILDTPWTPRRRVSAEHSFDLGAKCRGLLEMDCSCGVYAFTDAIEAFIYLTTVRDRLLGRSIEVALGTVSLWGKVVECERGYKAQYAYPRHIYLPASFARFLLQVNSAFGIPAGIYASTTDDEVCLSIHPGLPGREGQMLHLKNSGILMAPNVPYEVGFYDFQPLPTRGNGFPLARPDFTLPVSGRSEESGDAFSPP